MLLQGSNPYRMIAAAIDLSHEPRALWPPHTASPRAIHNVLYTPTDGTVLGRMLRIHLALPRFEPLALAPLHREVLLAQSPGLLLRGTRLRPLQIARLAPQSHPL